MAVHFIMLTTHDKTRCLVNLDDVSEIAEVKANGIDAPGCIVAYRDSCRLGVTETIDEIATMTPVISDGWSKAWSDEAA